MPLNALSSFQEKKKDVEYLLEVHSLLTGSDPGKRAKRIEVFNKSALIFVSAVWEAYCEELLLEATDFVVDNVTSSNSLPPMLRRNVAKSIKPKIQDNIESAWRLAEDWKSETKEYVKEKIKQLNTASSSKVVELFREMLGIQDVSSSWRWQNMTPEQSRKSLDKYCDTRHRIAHGSSSGNTIKKADATAFLQLTEKLAEVTEAEVHVQVQKLTGKQIPW